MDQQSSRGIITLISPEGKIHHQVVGQITEAEFLGILFYMSNLPHNNTQQLTKISLGALDRLANSLGVLVENFQRLSEKEEGQSCQQELSSESSPS